MKSLNTHKRIAAELLGVGENRVYFDPFRIEEISQAITRSDIADLIKSKAIRRRIIKNQKRHVEKRTIREGSVKMTVVQRKRDYINKIRKLRRFLNDMLEKKIVTKEEWTYIRKLAKAGQFKSRRHLIEYLTIVLKKEIKNEKTNKSPVQKKKAK